MIIRVTLSTQEQPVSKFWTDEVERALRSLMTEIGHNVSIVEFTAGE